MSSNPVHGWMNSLQHCVINFVSDMRQVSGSLGILFSSTNKTDRQDITEILLKVALNHTTLTLYSMDRILFADSIFFQNLPISITGEGGY